MSVSKISKEAKDNLAFYFWTKNNFNLKKAKTELRKHMMRNYKSNPSEKQLMEIFGRVRNKINKPMLYESLQMQLLTTTQNILDQSIKTFENTKDVQDIMDVTRFVAEISGFLQQGVEITQNNNTNVEFNVDEILSNITTGIDRISPILERVGNIRQLTGGKSPFYVHPSRKTEAFLVGTEQGNLGDGWKP